MNVALVSRKIAAAFANARQSLAEARLEWSRLYSSSFDADAQTLLLISQWTQYCQIVDNALLFFTNQKIRPLQIQEATASMPAVNRHFNSVLVWGRNQVEKLTNVDEDNAIRITKHNINWFKDLISQMASVPPTLPRFFFQRIYNTSIKLNILPQPKPNENSITITTKQLPVTVEGMIQSTNPKPIESVQVVATVTHVKDSSTYTQKRMISLENEGHYFKAQFLLNVAQSAKIRVGISFTDAESKRKWEDETTASLVVHTTD
ncbi:hypothetical protein AAVH_06178 [Aphelenchoides avenae]|nr:hypothetical protein AAVH_06178 [Aphelenchus avenae]